MINLDEKHVLFIEPRKNAAKVPVQDELTTDMREAMEHAARSEYVFFGHHRCICSAASDPYDWFLNTGHKTNSLAVHYLEYHRAEVPRGEMKKVREICADVQKMRPVWAAAAEKEKARQEERTRRFADPYCPGCGGHFLAEAESYCPRCGGTFCLCGTCFCV